MKKTILLLFIMGFAINMQAQNEKARPLLQDNEIVGCWKYMDSGNLPTLVDDNDSVRYVWFGFTSKPTVLAKDYDHNAKQFSSTSNFVAYTDGTSIYGKIFKSHSKNLEGKEVNFQFTYKKGKDRLILSRNNYSYTFERIDPLTLEKINQK